MFILNGFRMIKTMGFRCQCFYQRNFYLPRVRGHFFYENGDSFRSNYASKYSDEQLDLLEKDILAELERRQHIESEIQERTKLISGGYRKLHPELWTLQDSMFDRRFTELVEFAKSCSSAGPLIERIEKMRRDSSSPWDNCKAERVYAFPVFTEDFCAKFVEELEHFESRHDLPKGRPNTMNQGGFLLSELGFDPLIDGLRDRYVMPLARLLYPDTGGDSLNSQRAFVVKYAPSGDVKATHSDVDLSYHFDNAEVTLNVCLGKDFVESELFFGGMVDDEVEFASSASSTEGRQFHSFKHKLGLGLIHRGQHKHGAMPISDGVRYNLICWFRSSSARNKLCPMCGLKPTLVQVDGPGDGFSVK